MAQEPPRQTNPLLISESPMQFLPTLAMATNANCALFAQQLQYWLNFSRNVKNGRYWVYNTLDEWHLQFPWWSYSTLRRVTQTLQDIVLDGEHYKVLLIDTFNDDVMNHRQWYTLDYDELNRLTEAAKRVMMTRKRKLVLESQTLQRHYVQLVARNYELPPTLTELYTWGDEAGISYQKLSEKPAAKEPTLDKKSAPNGAKPEPQKATKNPTSAKASNDENPDLFKMNKSMCSKWTNGDTTRVQGDSDPRFVQNEQIDVLKMDSRFVQNEQIDALKMSKPTIIQENTIQENTSSLPSTPSDGMERPSAPKNKRGGGEIDKPEDSRISLIMNVASEQGYPIRNQDMPLLMRLIAHYPVEQIMLAIKTAKAYGGRTLAYVSKILENEDVTEKGEPSYGTTILPKASSSPYDKARTSGEDEWYPKPPEDPILEYFHKKYGH